MIPTLFKLGPLEFHSYGLMLAISFVIGIQLALPEGRRRGLPEDRLAALALWILVLSIAGSRLAYVVTHPGSLGNWLEAFKIWEGGLTMYGGLIAALVGAFILVRRWRLPMPQVFDSFAPSIALGEGITRIGCFLNGCCFGHPCDLPWAVTFPPESHAGSVYPGLALHPTQLYLSLAGFAIFALLWAVRKRIRTPGRIFFLFLLLECVARFSVDLLRHYEQVGESVALFGGYLSLTQVLCLGLILIAVVGLLRKVPVPPAAMTIEPAEVAPASAESRDTE